MSSDPASPEQQPSAQYRVAVFAVPDERETLVPILALIPGITAIDARVRLHDLPGVIPEHLDQETSDLLVAKLHEAGVEAAAVPEEELPKFARRPTVHHVRCLADGLEFIGLGGAAESVLPWEEVALVSIGDVPVDRGQHEVAAPTTLVYSAPGVHGSETISKGAHGPEMWLVREEPFQAWNIDHLEMNYEYLGDLKSTSAMANFRIFAEDLADHAQAAYFTPSARAFLQTQPAEDYRFVSREAHTKAVQLHVLLRRHMRRG